MSEMSPDEQDPRIQMQEKMKHLSPERQKAINDAMFAMQQSVVEMELRGGNPQITTQVAELGRNIGETMIVNSSAEQLNPETQNNISGILEVANTALESRFTIGAASSPIEPARLTRLQKGFSVIRSHAIDVNPEEQGGLIVKRKVSPQQPTFETKIRP